MTEYNSSGESAVTVHPGDLVQVTDQTHPLYRAVATVQECHRWGVGAMFMAMVDGKLSESYQRLKPTMFAVVGVAALTTGDVQRARKDSIETAALVAREAKA